MSDAARFLLATLCGIVVAGMTHISAILIMPWLSQQDALTRLRSTATAEHAQIIASPGGLTWLPSPDPAVAIAACAYDLREGPLRVAARTSDLFQSLAFHSRAGGVFYTVTDGAAIRGALDLVVMTRTQLDQALAMDDDEMLSRDLRIVAPTLEGFVIVRVLAPFESQRQKAAEVAQAVTCTTEPPPGEA